MTSSEVLLEQRLRRMRWFAGGLLSAMLLLFLVVSRYRASYPGLGVVQAFAEAALVGGLADWFAVTALFRHPLGLPIPHTAIVSRRKDAIGRALAGFIHDHFLERGAVTRRLGQADLAARFGHWLSQPANAQALGRDIATALNWLLQSGASAELRRAVQGSLGEALDRARVSALLAAAIDVLAQRHATQPLVDALVGIAHAQLEANKDRLRERIRERSPWWMPRFVDQEIFDRLVQESERILTEIQQNPDHEARQQLTAQLQRFKAALAEDSALDARARALREAFLHHPAVRAYISDLWDALRRYTGESLADPDSPLRLGLTRELGAIGGLLTDQPAARAMLDAWLRDLLLYLVDAYRRPLSEIVSGTIAEWDPSATAARLELYLGRDLQFVRINGTLVGGLVGVAIYGLAELLGA
jgi:uncharacterized membrane-anchored protein YjiN (DUF445 family)